MKKKIPKYMELVSWVEEQVKEKKLVPGQKLYSENELSKMFGVSRETVRHAIDILEKDNVLNRVQGSGTYINDARLQNLANRSKVAVITTYVDGYIFPRMIQGLENTLFKQGYTVQIAFTNNLFQRERTILKDILERDEVAGIICETVKSALPSPNLNIYHEIMKKKIPVLFINSFYPALPLPHVSMNDKQAGKLAAKYLLDRGHKKIGGIFKLDDGQGHLRYAGFLEALDEAGVRVNDANIMWVDTWDVGHLDKCSSRILERMNGATGIVVYNDQVAFSLLEILKKANYSVPEDVSLVSIDDSELAILGNVKLTSIPYPMEKLGVKSAQTLLEMIKDPRVDGNYEFELKVTERDSVKRID